VLQEIDQFILGCLIDATGHITKICKGIKMMVLTVSKV